MSDVNARVRANLINLADAEPTLRAILTRLQAEQRRSTTDALGGNPTPTGLMAAVDDAYARFDRDLKLLPKWKLACKAGCAWCCHGPVQTNEPEALRIAEYLRERLQPQRLAAARQRLDSLDEQARAARGLPAAGRLPCPLLVNNRCSVYPVRPLACRGWNSADADRCREDLLGTLTGSIPVRRLQLALQAAIGAGLEEGLRVAGSATHVLALGPALRVAFETSSATERWLSGDAFFDTARWVEN